MSDAPSSPRRRQELLADRAIFGLTPEESHELSMLGGHNMPGDELAITAAALDLGLHGDAMAHEALPPGLRQATLDAVRTTAEEDRKLAPPVSPGSLERRTASETTRRDWLGWAVAAAAIAVAAFSFTRQPSLSESSPIEWRAELLREAKLDPTSVVNVVWTKGEDPTSKNASGQVLWSDRLQRGVMEFAGLEPNDPKQNQYQLWIFDADRPEATPVDGGVFDIPAGKKEVLIPVDARLPIKQATLFAITVEKPGGVVVSDRKRLPLLAPVPKLKDEAVKADEAK
ncbi:anti-sigma factor domain-containing protein [Lacipirellula sp.]|uniref:anti-sigma factor domain-containing protein n=1 Tax=Lacipirellula sp. TaxID=2691419 RepID=UPI003D09EF43